MNILYFKTGDSDKNKTDKGLLTPEQLKENSQKKAQNIELSKSISGLMSRNEGKLLTNDGREIFNENK